MSNTKETSADTADIMTARKGDIVRFASYALRVEVEPVLTLSSITLHGRKSTDGCPLVTKRFMRGSHPNVRIERAPSSDRSK